MQRGVDPAEAANTATLPHHAFPLHRPHERNRSHRNLPLAFLEIGNQGGSIDVVLPHVVVVDLFLFECSLLNQKIDGSSRGVGSHEEGASVDLAQDGAVDLHERVRPDHLEVEDDPVRDERFSEPTQDVHDVLGLHSSERPREEHDVEG